MSEGSPEFKRWLALYFIEKGSWRVTDKGVEEFGKDETPRQTMEFAEHYSSREREERMEYRLTLSKKEMKQLASKRIEIKIDEGEAWKLYESNYITFRGNWKDKNDRITVIKKLIEVLGKELRDIRAEDFTKNKLAGLLNRYNSSQYAAIKEAFPELDIKPWEMKSTPSGFYEEEGNRIDAIKWLVRKLKKDPRDLTQKDFEDNRLGGLICFYYKNSPHLVVTKAFPELDIKPWEMKVTPNGFYDKKETRIAAIKWLIEKLKKDPRDLTQEDFYKNRLSGLYAGHYDACCYKAVKEAFPEMEIKPWEMVVTPRSFFDNKKNRISAVKWLLQRLEKDPRDLTQEDFCDNRLTGLLTHQYKGSPYKAIEEAFSELDIKPWEMKKTPNGFYDKKETRIAAIKWLIEKLKKDPRDICVTDFTENGLYGLLEHHSLSPYKAIKEAFPEMDIEPWEMIQTSHGFYKKKENRVAAVKWLVDKLDKNPRDVVLKDFNENRLWGLINKYYNNSPYKAVKEAGLVSEADEEYMRKRHGTGFLATPSLKQIMQAARKIERNATKKQEIKRKSKGPQKKRL
jgi:endonuclease III-like uncharacterized protein